jgi:hypothetical protein
MNYPSLARNINKMLINAVYTHFQCGPIFGGGHDIFVADQSNANTNSYTNFGHTYALDNLTLFNSWNQSIKSTFLTGAYNFQTFEIEVYASNFSHLFLFDFV